MPAQGGPAVQLTTDGGIWPDETPDGRFIYYVKWDKAGLFRLPAEGGKEVQVLPRLLNPNAWALTAKGLYFIESRNYSLHNTLAEFRQSWSPPILRFQHFVNGPARNIAELGLGPSLGLCVSPEGEYVLGGWFQIRGDLMLVEGFR